MGHGLSILKEFGVFFIFLACYSRSGTCSLRNSVCCVLIFFSFFYLLPTSPYHGKNTTYWFPLSKRSGTNCWVFIAGCLQEWRFETVEWIHCPWQYRICHPGTERSFWVRGERVRLHGEGERHSCQHYHDNKPHPTNQRWVLIELKSICFP